MLKYGDHDKFYPTNMPLAEAQPRRSSRECSHNNFLPSIIRLHFLNNCENSKGKQLHICSWIQTKQQIRSYFTEYLVSKNCWKFETEEYGNFGISTPGKFNFNKLLKIY